MKRMIAGVLLLIGMGAGTMFAEDGLGVVGAAAARRVGIKPQAAQGGGLAQANVPDLG